MGPCARVVELHAWAGGLEAQAMLLTKAILSFTQDADVLAVLLSVAVLPAICEEWLFRGTVQPIVVRATGNMHLGIWVSTVLFSAIHMQFFCFVPRMLLGLDLATSWLTAAACGPPFWGISSTTQGVVLAAFWMGEEWIDEGFEPQALSSYGNGPLGVASIALLALAWSLRTLFSIGATRTATSRPSALGPSSAHKRLCNRKVLGGRHLHVPRGRLRRGSRGGPPPQGRWHRP